MQNKYTACHHIICQRPVVARGLCHNHYEQARQRGVLKNLPRKNENHGLSKHPLRPLYWDMRRRCEDPKAHNYRWYGARGIKVCDGWKNSLVDFVKDVGERPEGTTLDRRDPDGDYSPENCQWVTWREQVENRRPKGYYVRS